MPKQAYRVLQGIYAEDGPDGRPRMYGPREALGDVVETEKDLMRFNSPGSIKFDRVNAPYNGPVTPDATTDGVTPVPTTTKPPPSQKLPPPSEELLQTLNIDQLRKIAQEEMVEIPKNLNNKDEISNLNDCLDAANNNQTEIQACQDQFENQLNP